MTYLQPRSINVGGRRTTVRLEGPYWDELQRISVVSGRTVGQILTDLEAQRPTNFTSAIRVLVLATVRAESDRARGRLEDYAHGAARRAVGGTGGAARKRAGEEAR